METMILVIGIILCIIGAIMINVPHSKIERLKEQLEEQKTRRRIDEEASKQIIDRLERENRYLCSKADEKDTDKLFTDYREKMGI